MKFFNCYKNVTRIAKVLVDSRLLLSLTTYVASYRDLRSRSSALIYPWYLIRRVPGTNFYAFSREYLGNASDCAGRNLQRLSSNSQYPGFFAWTRKQSKFFSQRISNLWISYESVASRLALRKVVPCNFLGDTGDRDKRIHGGEFLHHRTKLLPGIDAALAIETPVRSPCV